MIGRRQKTSLMWILGVLSQDLLFFAAVTAIGLSGMSLFFAS